MSADPDRIADTITRQKRYNARDIILAVLLAGMMIGMVVALP